AGLVLDCHLLCGDGGCYWLPILVSPDNNVSFSLYHCVQVHGVGERIQAVPLPEIPGFLTHPTFGGDPKTINPHTPLPEVVVQPPKFCPQVLEGAQEAIVDSSLAQ